MDPDVRLEAIVSQIRSLMQEVEALRRDLSRQRQPQGDSPVAGAAEAFSAVISFLAIGPTLEEDSLLNTILKCAMHATGAGGAGLTLLDAKTRKLVFRAAIGDGAEGILGYEVPLAGSQHGLAFATGEVQAAAPIHAEIEEAAGTGFRNVLVAPLVADGEPIGTLSAVNKQGASQFTVQDMEAYKLFSDLAALVVRQRSRETLLARVFSGHGEAPPQSLAGLAIGKRESQLTSLVQRIARLSLRSEGVLHLIEQFVAALENQSPERP
jgi:GAF domain-containing protein